jgi:cytochrome c-type biogenesis protein CcmH
MQPALRAALDPLGAKHAGARSLAVLALVLVALVGAASPLRAQPEEGWGYALADELMSPWCPGFALPDCSSGYAQELRLWILEQERLGRSEEEVKAEILAKYGEQMLQAPSAKGRGILAYAIPASLIFAGLAVLVAFLRKQGQSRGESAGIESPAPNAQAIDARLLSRVDDEIAESAND